MRKTALALILILVTETLSLAAHDLFLKPADYFVAPGATVTVHVLNGTFTSSENAVARNRLVDLSVVAGGTRTTLDTGGWRDRGDTSAFDVPTGPAGTYAIGASLRPRELRLTAEQFNAYLAEDGIDDVLAARRRTGQLGRPARERYSKHAKALIQVGDTRTAGFDTPFGYPAELVPLDNPYTMRPGAALRLRALVRGVPMPGQVVIVGGRGGSGQAIAERQARSDAQGTATVTLPSAGVWYVKFVHMEPAAGDTTVDYVSRWATLTFAVR